MKKADSNVHIQTFSFILSDLHSTFNFICSLLICSTVQPRCWSLTEKNLLQAYKPDPVFQYKIGMAIIYLFVMRSLKLRTTKSICLPCPSNEPLLNGTIRGISACKVYPRLMLPSKAVSSYLTFSPLPAEALAKVGSP
jgi:hypothetical protein